MRAAGGACMAGGHAWQGACMAGGVHGRGTCVAGKKATTVDGTHPARMHCYFKLKYRAEFLYV